MPSPTLYVQESAVWQTLRVDLAENGDSPPVMEPVDRDHIHSLILSAQERLARFCGDLEEFDPFPEGLKQAIALDVSVHYFNRIAPELPDQYFEFIMPHREWGFGRDVSD